MKQIEILVPDTESYIITETFISEYIEFIKHFVTERTQIRVINLHKEDV